jgi:hypothetical protein
MDDLHVLLKQVIWNFIKFWRVTSPAYKHINGTTIPVEVAQQVVVPLHLKQ